MNINTQRPNPFQANAQKPVANPFLNAGLDKDRNVGGAGAIQPTRFAGLPPANPLQVNEGSEYNVNKPNVANGRAPQLGGFGNVGQQLVVTA